MGVDVWGMHENAIYFILFVLKVTEEHKPYERWMVK